jgi:hypothetical protein
MSGGARPVIEAGRDLDEAILTTVDTRSGLVAQSDNLAVSSRHRMSFSING